MEIITPELKFIADDIKAKSTPPPMVSQIPSILNQKGGFASMVIKDERSKRSLSGYSNVKHSDIFAEKEDGTYIAKYDSYDNSGGNQEEYFAQKQTTGEKWTNGALKLLGKTGTAILGGTVGVVDGLIEGIYKGSLSEGYNSGVNKWLDGLNTTMEYTLPNRYTEQDREASLLGQMGQANFWADKAFGGLSFTLGALVSEGIWGAATGGASLLSSGNRLAKLANWTAKGLGGEARLVRAMNVAKTTAKGSVDNLLEGIVANEGNVLRTINDATKSSASNYYQFKKLGEIGLVATRSAGFESGMEARQYMNSTEHAWLEKYQEANGKEPSLEEYSTFKDGLTNSANAVFGANMAIVGGSNIAQFGSALLGRTTNPAIGNSLIKRNLFGIGFDKTVSDAGKITYKALEASGRQKVAGRVWGVLGSAVTESQEEMSQRVVSLTAENFMLGGIDPKHIKSTYDMAEAFTDAMNNTYGTKEGWSEGLVGAVVGVFGAGAHSRFKFGGVTAERENVKDVTTYANSFTAENHFNNLIANTKIMQAQEYKESAVSKKDIVGEQLADTMSSIAFIERNQAIGNTKEAVSDLALQMNAISDEDLAEELGFGKGGEAKKQAAEFKEHKIAEFKNLAQTHEKNLNYAEALFGETEIAGFDKFSTREAIRAVATTITLGDKSLKINQDLVNHVKALVADSVNLEGVTDAMSVQQILDLAPREKTLKLSQLNVQYFILDRQEKELKNKEFEASKLTDTEDNKARTNTLTDLAKQIQDLQNKKEEIREQKQLALDAIGVKTYSDVDVTVEMFDAQNENLEKLKETLANIKKTNPERYSEISKALVAQSKAVAHIKGYQKTIEMIGDPKSRIKILNGWLTKFTNKTKLSDSMEAYITSVITDNTEQIEDTFQTGVDVTERANFRKIGEVSEEYKQQVGKARRRGEILSETDKKIYEKFKAEIEENAKETIEEKEEETTPQEVSNLQKLKDRVKAIISSNDYLTQYFGQDLAEQKKSKPSETDIKKYEELLSKIDRRVESNISKIVTSPEKYYDSAIGLSNEEIDELVEVQTKLNDWLTLEGALDKDNQSVAQMLDLISSLEAVKNNENVLVTPTYESVLSSKSEEEEGMNTNFIRGLQTPTEALATVRKGVLRISHLRTKTLETFFPGSNLVDNTNGSFTLLLPSGKSLNIEENEEGGQDIDLDEWNSVEAESNVLIKNFGTKSQAISQALPSNPEIFQNIPSDFGYEQTDGSNMQIDKDAVNAVKNGEILELFVSTLDVFNSKLEKSEKAKQLHIYVMKGGKLLGSLPASSKKNAVEGVGLELVDLRREAYDFIKANKYEETLIKLPQQIKAQISFIGAPNLTLTRNEDGVVETKTEDFTKESLQHVVGQGFILDGIAQSETKIDVNQFTRAISKGNLGVKIPFVVFNYNGKNISFPIKLKTNTSNKSVDALNGENTAEKAKSLIDALIQNNLKTYADKIDFSDADWIDTPAVDDALKALKQVVETVSIDKLASKNYAKEELIKDAEIAIALDNKPFNTNKVMLTTTSEIAPDVLGYRELREAKKKEIQQVKEDLSNLARRVEIAQLNNRELDNNLTDVFSDNPTVKGDIEGNITILRNALKGISRKTSKLLGIDLINLAKSKLKELTNLETTVKNIAEQIKKSPYYKDVDPALLVVDENGEIENPAITQEAIIEELGGIKDFEEFEEKAQEIETLNKNGQFLLDLFEETREMDKVEVRVITKSGLENKPNTEVRDTLVATMRDTGNNLLLNAVNTIASYSSEVLSSNSKEAQILLKEIEKKALDNNIDLEGISDIEALLPYLQKVLNPSATEEDFNNFVEAYLKAKSVVETPLQGLVRVADRFKGLKMVILEADDYSEYKLFKDYGFLHIDNNIYLVTDGHEAELAEVERKIGSIDIADQMQDVITDDAEYELDTVKKFIHYKNHFETPSRKVKNVDSQLKKIGKGVVKPKKSVVTTYRYKQLKKEDKALQNLVFNEKGITLKHTDKQSVDKMNEYLKKEVELRNYFLLSRYTNFEVAIDEVTLVSMRDALYNGYRLEPFKGDHFRVNDETRQVITESNFVTIGMDNYERVIGNIFAKIGKNESEFLEVDVEQPKLNVNPENLTSRSTVAQIKTSNNYTGEEGFIIDKENSCES